MEYYLLSNCGVIAANILEGGGIKWHVLFMHTHVTAYFMLLHLLLVAITHCDLPQSQRVIIVQTIAMEPGPKPV